MEPQEWLVPGEEIAWNPEEANQEVASAQDNDVSLLETRKMRAEMTQPLKKCAPLREAP